MRQLAHQAAAILLCVMAGIQIDMPLSAMRFAPGQVGVFDAANAMLSNLFIAGVCVILAAYLLGRSNVRN